ncbi:MAG: hypothetical protein HOO98_07125 [Nitrospira sp.]|nr:hypothetical protein [Nitrospira sp.]
MSTTYLNAVGPHVRAPQSKPDLVIPFLACASLVGGLQSATHHAATVVTGTTTADVLSGVLVVTDGAHLVDHVTQDARTEDVAEAPLRRWSRAGCVRSSCCEWVFGVKYSHADRSRN